MEIKDKVCLVTGAANGIGFQIVMELLKYDVKGVLLADIDKTLGQKAVKILQEKFDPKKFIFLKTDVTNEEEFENAFKKTIELFGKLDILVNNAGILQDVNYDLEINVNFKAVLKGTMLGWKYMGKNQLGSGGLILNMCSAAAYEYIHCFPIYSGTKAAILNVTRGLGHPFHSNKTGVAVVGLCPGYTKTDLIKKGNMLENCEEEILKLLAGKESQLPEVVARAAMYVIKDGTSATIWMIDENKLSKLHVPEWKTIAETIVPKI